MTDEIDYFMLCVKHIKWIKSFRLYIPVCSITLDGDAMSIILYVVQKERCMSVKRLIVLQFHGITHIL